MTKEIGRDISAARAELRGRRDQLVADYDERLTQLDGLSESLEGGNLSPKIVGDRVRQLLGDHGGIAARGARIGGGGGRAGRTQIGMQMPNETTAPSGRRVGPTPAITSANVDKVMARIDGRIVTVILNSDPSREEARLELSLLTGLRRTMEQQSTDLPTDVVLLESIMEFTEHVQLKITDLEAGGVGRLQRLLEYDRELASHLVALGGSAAHIKEQLKKAHGLLGTSDPNLSQALHEALKAFSRLQQELDQRFPKSQRALVDELLSG